MPMSLAEMERNLVALRLPGMKETLETRALQARSKHGRSRQIREMSHS